MDEARALARRRGILTWLVDECATRLDERLAEIVGALSDFSPIGSQPRSGRVA